LRYELLGDFDVGMILLKPTGGLSGFSRAGDAKREIELMH
jgi:hypothetical protein